MLRRFILLCTLLATATGCTPKKERTCKADKDFSQPAFKVALIPVVNSSEDNLPWSVGDELTGSIRRFLAEKTKVWGCPLAEIQYSFQYFPGQLDFRSRVEKSDFSFCTYLGCDKPIVVVQLVEHDMVAFQEEEVSTLFPAEANLSHQVLKMKARILLLDYLGELICEDVLTAEYLLDPDWLRYDEKQYPWPKASYFFTPLAKAHAKFANDAALRIEQLVKLNVDPPKSPCPRKA